MKFEPAFVNLDRRLSLLSEEERKEKVRDLTVGKDPKHFASIVSESPDSLLARMAYFFTEEIVQLLDQDTEHLIHMTRGRLYLALAQAWAREVHEMPGLEGQQTQSYRKHFTGLASKALSSFRQARKTHPEDAHFYAAKALEMKGNINGAIREMNRYLKGKTNLPGGLYNELGSIHMSAIRFTNEYLEQQEEKISVLLKKISPPAAFFEPSEMNDIDQFLKSISQKTEGMPLNHLCKLYEEYLQHLRQKPSHARGEKIAHHKKTDFLEKCIKVAEAKGPVAPRNQWEAMLLKAQREWFHATLKKRKENNTWHALQAFQKALKCDDPFPAAWSNLSTLYGIMGRKNKSRTCLEEAIQQGVVSAEFLLGQWYVQNSNEDPEEMRRAVPHLRSYISKASLEVDEVGNVYLEHAKELLKSLLEMKA